MGAKAAAEARRVDKIASFMAYFVCLQSGARSDVVIVGPRLDGEGAIDDVYYLGPFTEVLACLTR